MVQSKNMERQYTYTIEIHPGEKDETGFWVSVPALPGCFSRGATYQEAISNSREAIELHIEGLLERGEKVPVETEPSFITHVNVAMPQIA
jgi:antitoxin HicB